MSIFDAYISKVAAMAAGLRAERRPFIEWNCPTTTSELLTSLPVHVGPQASSGLVLRGDTFVELGSPEVGSCYFLLWTDSATLIRDGLTTLIGPDIPESKGLSLPFGQFLMVGGKNLSDKEHQVLERSQIISNQIEGYMIKSTSERMWSRVSKDAASKGFSFETLGRALMAIFKSQLHQVEAMEVLFVTSAKADLERFDDLATQVRQIGGNITKEIWKSRGYDIECTLGGDCNACSSKSICDDIRDMVSLRKRTFEKVEAVTG